MTRQDANFEILNYVKEHYPEYDENIYSTIYYLIEKYIHQRFGQIICNYICPDYRDRDVSTVTQNIMKDWFDIDYDPFFEESVDTLNRLKQHE